MSEGRIDRRRGKGDRRGFGGRSERRASLSPTPILLYCLVMQILRRRDKRRPLPSPPSPLPVPSPLVVLRACLPFSRRARTHVRTHAFIMRVISGAACTVTGGAKRGERTFRRKQWVPDWGNAGIVFESYAHRFRVITVFVHVRPQIVCRSVCRIM